LGIDFGTTFIKVSYVQPGKAFDIVLNEAGKRKTDNVIAFARDSRIYGSTASALSARDPEHVFFRTRDLLGVSAHSAEVQHLEALEFPYELEENPSTGGFKVVMDKGTSKERKLLPEELVAMILTHVQRLASDFTESKVVDCVLTVPPHFSQAQRESLLIAAEIAGLKVLTLIDENVAAAVQHGVYTEFNNASHKMLLYNMGSASTKVTLLDFYGKLPQGAKASAKPSTQIDVLAKAWDRTLGGDSLDMLLVEMILDNFEQTHGTQASELRASRRALERVRAQATKIKTVLSANAEFPVSIESLHDGRDVRFHVTRQQLEDAGKALFERVIAPVEKVLGQAGLTVEDIDAVEIIGGGVRVPRVKEILSQYLQGKELGTHLNGDESKALGAVFVGANMSKAFRVRPVGLREITMDAVQLDLVEAGDVQMESERWAKSAVLFKTGDALDSRKIVSVNVSKDFTCELSRTSYESNERTTVAFYEISGVTEAIEQFGQFGEPKVSLTIKLDQNDTVNLLQAEAIFVEKLTPSPEEAADATASEDVAGDAEDAASEENSDSDNSEEVANEAGEDTEASTADDAGATADGDAEAESNEADKTKADKTKSKKKTSSKKSKKKKAPTQRTHRFALTVKRTDKGRPIRLISEAALAEAREVLASFEKYEEERRNHEAVKNEVESFVFEARDQVRSAEEEVDLVMTEEDKTQLFDDLEELEDWLDGDGADAPLEEYKTRRLALERRIRKLMNRIAELDQRPATIRAARVLISTVKNQVESVWAKERPWITLEEKQHVLAQVAKFSAWLDDVEAQQAALTSQEPAAVTSSEIMIRLESVQAVLEHALRRPLPTFPKKKKSAAKVKVNTTDDATTTEETDEDADSQDEKDDAETESNQGENTGAEEKDEL